MTVGILWDDRYLLHEAPRHPEQPGRLRAIRRALEDAGLWNRLAPIAARLASDADLGRVHTSRHIAAVRASAAAADTCWFDGDTYACRHSAEAALLAAGGVCAAVDAVVAGRVRSAFCAVRPPGHHASADRAMGFCLFNNIAVAARYAQAVHGLSRILIVDWDVHHGNGTQDVFYCDGDVFYFSIHQSPLYPGTGRPDETGHGAGVGKTLNLPLRPGRGDEEFLAALDRGLLVAETHRPELVLISAGFDAHRDDPIGGLAYTEQGYAEATRRVRAFAERHAGGKVVSVLEGGYNESALGECVAAHVRALAEP